MCSVRFAITDELVQLPVRVCSVRFAITDETPRLPDQRSIAIPDKVLLFWFNISLSSIDERSVVSEYIAQAVTEACTPTDTT